MTGTDCSPIQAGELIDHWEDAAPWLELGAVLDPLIFSTPRNRCVDRLNSAFSWECARAQQHIVIC